MHAYYCDPVLCIHLGGLVATECASPPWPPPHPPTPNPTPPTPTSYPPPSLFSQRSRRCHSVYGRIYQTISLQTESSHQSVKYLFLPPDPNSSPPPTSHRLPSYSLHQLLHLSAAAAADFELCVCARAHARSWMCVRVCAGTHVCPCIVAGAQLSELSITFARR